MVGPAEGVRSPLYTGGTSTPSPDPTQLTTSALQREIAALRELLEARITGDSRAVEARFGGHEKAVVLLQHESEKLTVEVEHRIDRLHVILSEKVEHLQALHTEKFLGIATQFAERDNRVEQTSRDSKLAIDAALQAAKEAVGKTETVSAKQIDQLTTLIGVTTKNLEDQLRDVKERLDRSEGKTNGVGAAWGVLVAAAGVVFAGIGVALALAR